MSNDRFLCIFSVNMVILLRFHLYVSIILFNILKGIFQ